MNNRPRRLIIASLRAPRRLPYVVLSPPPFRRRSTMTRLTFLPPASVVKRFTIAALGRCTELNPTKIARPCATFPIHSVLALLLRCIGVGRRLGSRDG